MRALEIIVESLLDFGFDDTDTGLQETFRRYLVRSVREICARSRSIQHVAYLAATADIYEYALPDDFLAMRVVRWQDDPPLVKSTLRDIYNRRYAQKSGSDPTRYDVWGRAHRDRVSGTATGGSGTTLDDTAKNFTGPVFPEAAVKPNDLVFNLTDDSEAIVDTVAATQITFKNPLQGGTDNTFASGDSYEIVSAHAPNHRLILWPAPSANDTVGSESIGILYAAAHRDITSADLTNGADELEIDIELETALIHRMEYWAHGPGTPERRQSLIDYNTAYQQGIPLVRRRVEDAISMWSTSDIIRQNLVTGPVAPTGHILNTTNI